MQILRRMKIMCYSLQSVPLVTDLHISICIYIYRERERERERDRQTDWPTDRQTDRQIWMIHAYFICQWQYISCTWIFLGHAHTVTHEHTYTASITDQDTVVQFQCWFTSTETIRSIREPRTATSTFTQVSNSAWLRFSSVLFYVHMDHKHYQGRGAEDGHLHFHFYTAPELWIS